ncbi:MAG: hypothetical protein AB7P69_10765 [Candidatus Binatia bacterium]
MNTRKRRERLTQRDPRFVGRRAAYVTRPTSISNRGAEVQNLILASVFPEQFHHSLVKA